MRLLAAEHNAFQELIKLHSASSEITHWKKGGWVYFKSSSKESVFGFHRKKEARIVDGKFVDLLSYFISLNNEKREHSSFEGVLKDFKKWLESQDENSTKR